jgi:hypothetical protein
MSMQQRLARQPLSSSKQITAVAVAATTDLFRPEALQRCHKASGNVLHDRTGSVISEPELQQPAPDTPAEACQQQ